ncbi:DUF2058 domain-containing protein [Salinisphaera sp. Q1T1-3]|uniref:DUF2058 domain-containing protein n=1 Tax=Salinisphaera sp. Q1T1-3 TaxID=2321229 RepID=UPI000E7567E4|nr:DUF2058 family protein [Salinisphaera sp. Q1T1-3]RJS93086.1 DUF2058 domain-containing protein [Salinisphaera sp. Q1T1-3]
MGQSLQDQLLKAGLANSKQARKAQQDKTGKKNKNRKKKSQRAPADAPSELSREVVAADAEKRRRDQERARRANAERAGRERSAAADQILAQNTIKREPAPEEDPPFSYTMEGRIRRLPVSRAQRAKLANGELGIVRRGGHTLLVDRATAERLAELIPKRISLAEKAPEAGPTDPEDPYAGYEVPDDLMW